MSLPSCLRIVALLTHVCTSYQIAARLRATQAALAVAESAVFSWQEHTQRIQAQWSEEKVALHLRPDLLAVCFPFILFFVFQSSLTDQIASLLSEHASLHAVLAQQPKLADSALFVPPSLPTADASLPSNAPVSAANEVLNAERQALQFERQRSHTLQAVRFLSLFCFLSLFLSLFVSLPISISL